MTEAEKKPACDIFKRPFALPVDDEHRATELKIFSIANPHMRQFHASWYCFFTTFVSTFAVAPLMSYVKADLQLSKQDIGNSGVASVAATIIIRNVMGVVCDKVGPRYGMTILMLVTIPGVIGMMFVQGAAGFIICRAFIGCGLATFVASQFWQPTMFAPKIVGLANATAAGWGNLGGGVTQLLMPVVFLAIQSASSSNDNLTWRLCMIVPALMHISAAALAISARDMPDGNYGQLEHIGAKKKGESWEPLKIGWTNVNALIMVLTYGCCFGVELTMNNIASLYFQEYHDMPVITAGLLASLYGLMNIFARSVGGLLSDWADSKWGMRGRLWCLWIIQTLEGISCVVLGIATGAGVAVCVAIMVVFPLFVQAAEGASYGVVPFISSQALGVVSGMIGAGGNAGAVINTSLWFRGAFETDTGIMYMGIYIIAVTSLCFCIYFPESGGMLFRPGALRYNPQLYKTTKDIGNTIDFSKGSAAEERPEGV
jgi:NNP family nitrate/nitrite transporter-like MFS transporter